MTGLESWLKQVTRHLAKESVAQVRTEIQEHYDAAREAALADGACVEEADTQALNALGHPKIANRQYRRILLTSTEAKVLREATCEARAICSRAWMKWLLLAVPIGAVAAAALLFAHHAALAKDVLIGGIGMSPLLIAPFLPVYTPSRARVFRCVKWVAMAGALGLVHGPETLKWSWLLIASLGPLASAEWTRASIRRKLPIAAWPKHLYL